jgi:hypothetical protein
VVSSNRDSIPETSESRRAASDLALNRVQRRVAAIGFFAVAVHAVFGLIGVAYVRENDGRHTDAVGLTVMSFVLAFIVYAVIRLLLGAKIWSPVWLVIALSPSIAALVWVLG